MFAFFGMSGVMTACYGVPYRSYEIKGSVTDEDMAPLSGILVSAPYSGHIYETTSSDDGAFYLHIYLDDIPEPGTIEVTATDIDGIENGGIFKSSTVTHEMNSLPEVNFILVKENIR